jgi:hypothetical protein
LSDNFLELTMSIPSPCFWKFLKAPKYAFPLK